MVANGEALLERSDELLRTYEQTGDERAFSQLVQNYRGMVFGVCLRVMRNTHDAEDATQAVFFTFAMQARGGNNIRMLGPWLQQVAQRVSLDMYKSRKRRIAREDIRRQQTHDRIDADEGRQLDQDELRETLRLQLNELPAKYRLPMILYYFGGLTPEAIAKELGCKKKTLGVRLFRARKMLAEQLASRGVVACGAPLLLALRDVMHQGLLQSLPASGAHYVGAGASAGLGLGFDHLSSTVTAMASALARFTCGSKLRCTLLLLILAGSGMAGSAGLIRDFTRIKPLKFIDSHLDSFDELLQTLPRIFTPHVLIAASNTPTEAPATPTRTAEQTIASFSTPRASQQPMTAGVQMRPSPAPAATPPPVKVHAAVSSVPVARGQEAHADLPAPVEHHLRINVPIATSLAGGQTGRHSDTITHPTSLPEEFAALDNTSVDSPSDLGKAVVSADRASSRGGGSLCFADSTSGGAVLNGFSANGLGSYLVVSGAFLDNVVSQPCSLPTAGSPDSGYIPEPTGISLLTLGVGFLLQRRHRSDNSQ